MTLANVAFVMSTGSFGSSAVPSFRGIVDNTSTSTFTQEIIALAELAEMAEVAALVFLSAVRDVLLNLL